MRKKKEKKKWVWHLKDALLELYVSPNKLHRQLINFEASMCGTYLRVTPKRARDLFQLLWNEISQMKSPDFFIFSFQVTINNYHYNRYS